jgi:radical SAM superfamily enzyme YgiQ (UPF0313 family)
MPQIVLATINARYIHASFGLRYLFANLGELQESATICEFENAQPAKEIAEALLIQAPSVVGFGVYIWNAVRTHEVVSILKKIKPELVIVLGGPEVSYEYEDQELVRACDYLITGEADRAFADLCRVLMRGERPAERVIHAGLPALESVTLPYSFYTDNDIAHRVIYVEVSRGCPFTCEFCLSSVDIPVRQFDHKAVLAELERLYARGARSFKFVDRTFNLNVRTSTSILQFFLDRMEPGLFVHFEMVPDRFPPALRQIVSQFPAGSLQLEIGVQSLNPDVGVRISRRQDVAKLIDNLRFLRTETAAHLHVDLIVGLPGEDIDSFASGFDQLVALDPHEIQVGILKRLKGTPIARHTDEFVMRFSDDPPYEVLSTRDLSFLDLQRMERFARYWDLVSNSGNFARSRALLWEGEQSPFSGFMRWSDWLYARVGRRAAIELKALTVLLFQFLVEERGLPRDRVGQSLAGDYLRGGRSDLPRELKEFAGEEQRSSLTGARGAKRQQRVVNM